MCRTTDSSFQSSNILNNAGIWSLIELASLYTVPLSAISGWVVSLRQEVHSRFENYRIGSSLSNRTGMVNSNANICRSIVFYVLLLCCESSVPVQMIAQKDLSLKWFIMCRMGRKTLLTHSHCFCLSSRIFSQVFLTALMCTYVVWIQGAFSLYLFFTRVVSLLPFFSIYS